MNLYSSNSGRRKNKVLRLPVHGFGAGQGGDGVDKIRRRVGGATGLAVVAVLIGRPAVGAGPLDKPIGEEQPFFGVVGLGDAARCDMLVHCS